MGSPWNAAAADPRHASNRPEPRCVSVLVADPQQAIRAGVRAVLAPTEFTVVAEAFTATTACYEARRSRPDICLLAVSLPGGGIEAAARIRRLLPRVRIVMLSATQDPEDLLDAIRAGAHGYLMLSIDPGRLAPVLRAVVRGEAPIPRALVTAMAEEMFQQGPRRPTGSRDDEDALTPREREVLDLLAQGLTTSKIARRLTISAGTVRSHVATILRKLEVDDREAAVRAARSPRPVGPLG